MQTETHTQRLPDGRILAWTEAGEHDGSPVFSFHGLPGSRFQRHPDDGIVRNRGLRLIHVERPGFGLSSPQPRRTLADWPRDVAALADALGFGRFAVLGISGGGPFALACAALLGNRVTRTAIVSGVGPPGSMKGAMNWVARAAFFLAPHAAWLLRPELLVGARLAMHFPRRFLDSVASHMSAPDRPILARPQVRAMLERDVQAAFAQGPDAVLCDLALHARPWNLPLAAIGCPTAFWHGTDDRMIPDSASRMLAQIVESSELRLVEGQGHFMVFDLWPEIVDWLTGKSERSESSRR
jgi:pimeloyl-ACP methyl ester carboxylesterase